MSDDLDIDLFDGLERVTERVNAHLKSRLQTAYHEASHCVLCERQGGAIGGAALYEDGSGAAMVYNKTTAECCVRSLAGGIGATLFVGSPHGDRCGSDFRKVIRLIVEDGGGEQQLKACISRAITLLKEPEVAAAVHCLADALFKRGELDGQEIGTLLKPWADQWKRLRLPLRIVRSRASSERRGVISATGANSFKAVKNDAGQIVDYQNVTIEGYLSTFKNVTESDRDGDYVEKGAFADTIKRNAKSPLPLLVNHRNQVENMAGSFVELKEDSSGLRFKAVLSNSPSDFMKHLRALVAENHLKTTSMGGIFHYKEDGRGIHRVDLLEGSLTPIPANPDALFSAQ